MERAAWTDERLDDLAEAMRTGFARVDADMRELRTELREGLGAVRDEIGGLRSDIDAQTAGLRSDIDALKTTLLRATTAGVVALIGVLAAVLTRV
jgi:hypothetical protein